MKISMRKYETEPNEAGKKSPKQRSSEQKRAPSPKNKIRQESSNNMIKARTSKEKNRKNSGKNRGGNNRWAEVEDCIQSSDTL